MSWINVVSERWVDLAIIRQRESADRLVRKDVCDLAFRLLRIKQPERLRSLELQIHEGADSALTDLKRSKRLGQYVASETTVGLLILSTLLGQDRLAGLRRLLSFEAASDAEGKARIAVLRRLFEPRERKSLEKQLSSYAGSESVLFRRIDTLPTAEALDLCNGPRGPSYRWSAGLILALAYVLAVERGTDLSLNAISELLACGANPERRGKLLFDCSVEPPNEPNIEEDGDSTTRYPFSAVEFKDGQLIAYWWVGFMKGKLVFSDSDGPNEFWMLAPERRARAWKLVRDRVGADVWVSIQQAVERNEVKYITVVDKTLVEVVEEDVLRAGKAYVIDLAIQHLFDV